MPTERTSPIRILHFISNSYPSGYFSLIAQYADHERFEMHVASLDRSGGLQAEMGNLGVSSFALGVESRANYPAAAARLARWLRRHRIDVIHTHLFEASLVGLTAAKLARTRLGIFTGHHSHEVPLHGRRALFELDRLAACRLADVVIAPSQEMAETFLSVYRCQPRRVEVIEHGIDLTRFDPVVVDAGTVRRQLGLEGKLVIGAISKHFWVKNLAALVEAFASLSAGRPDLHLVILGLGDRMPLSRLADGLGATHRVSILEPRPDVPEVLAAFDLFVHPALAESFGLAVVEAMAMGRPTVATPVGIARDVIEDEVSGIRIHGMDAGAIEQALRRALASRDRWPAMGVEARRRALRFTPERWVREHEELYERRLSAS